MNTLFHGMAAAAAVLGVLVPAASATAQVEEMLRQGQSGASGSLEKLGGIGSALSGGGLVSGSTGNVAGLLQYCIKNNFLKGQESSSIKDKLMGKLGGTPAPDTGYAEGTQGVLKSSDGKQLDLSGSGIQAQASRQVCDQILKQAKSLL